MANTYSQISIHAVFAVKGRENLITHNWENDLHRYISGIIKGNGAKSLAVGGWKDSHSRSQRNKVINYIMTQEELIESKHLKRNI